ncbi:hypothetical protein Golomagni_02037 [Golovinomyces magnicellulatus]|nr:hypothetical protein Golomagni_02037 [Golovinomyces magnicellulatus]
MPYFSLSLSLSLSLLNCASVACPTSPWKQIVNAPTHVFSLHLSRPWPHTKSFMTYRPVQSSYRLTELLTKTHREGRAANESPRAACLGYM